MCVTKRLNSLNLNALNSWLLFRRYSFNGYLSANDAFVAFNHRFHLLLSYVTIGIFHSINLLEPIQFNSHLQPINEQPFVDSVVGNSIAINRP